MFNKKSKNVTCFFHNADLDGHCSGAIVKLKYPNCKLIGIDYGDKFDWDLINENEIVFMVDFSLPMDMMIRLSKMCNYLFWIDHHISAIKEAEKLNFKTFRGRLDIKKAACELTWEYLYSSQLPLAVYLLGRYDVWDLTADPQILPFQYGMRIYETNPALNELDWNNIFLHDWTVDKFVTEGKTILKYQQKQNKICCNCCAFETELDGYKCIAINKPLSNSQLFDSIISSKYDIMISFSFQEDHWKASLYTKKENVDVSELAKSYGGGGHKQAAGFICQKLPFKLPDRKP